MVVNFLLFLLFFLAITAVVSEAFPSVPVVETCPSNADPIGGIWSTGVNGTTVGCRCLSGLIERQAATPGNGCYITNGLTTENQEYYHLLPNATNHDTSNVFRTFLCLSDEGTATYDGYGIAFTKVGAGTDTLQIVRYDNGTPTVLGANVGQEMDNGDSLGLQFLAGGTLNLWYRAVGNTWTQLATRSDATYTCTGKKVGLLNLHGSFDVDNFGAGDTPPASYRRRYQMGVLRFK